MDWRYAKSSDQSMAPVVGAYLGKGRCREALLLCNDHNSVLEVLQGGCLTKEAYSNGLSKKSWNSAEVSAK
jgi:hypothetical protein